MKQILLPFIDSIVTITVLTRLKTQKQLKSHTHTKHAQTTLHCTFSAPLLYWMYNMVKTSTFWVYQYVEKMPEFSKLRERSKTAFESEMAIKT